MSYKIYPILLGITKNSERSMFLYRTDCGTKMTAAYMCFLVQGNGHNILVDTGTPDPVTAESLPYPRLENAVFLSDELKKFGLEGTDIDTIILSHLHWDHCFNLELFPNAAIYVQKRELINAVAPSKIEEFAYTVKPGSGSAGWLKGFPQMKRIDGDFDLFEGIKLLLTPGHAPGQMSVLVDTAEGPFILAGDTLPIYENYEREIPNGITIDFPAFFESLEKIKALKATVIPGHDIRVMEHHHFG